MTSLMTIARPYAKAAFDVALSEGTLEKWENNLAVFATASQEPALRAIIVDPEVDNQCVVDCLTELSQIDDESSKRFLTVLYDAERLALLPEIKEIFDHLKEEHERFIDVDVFSQFPLNDDQQTILQQRLEKKLAKKVSLHCEIDENLLGGVVIRAGDLVINGSGRGQLEQLAEFLRGNAICQ